MDLLLHTRDGKHGLVRHADDETGIYLYDFGPDITTYTRINPAEHMLMEEDWVTFDYNGDLPLPAIQAHLAAYVAGEDGH